MSAWVPSELPQVDPDQQANLADVHDPGSSRQESIEPLDGMTSSAPLQGARSRADQLAEGVSPNAVSGGPRSTAKAVRAGRGSTIADHILGDEPAGQAKLDRLGFGPYVRAVSKFLTDPSTKIPITMSVEGVWGAGKSSFMLLLQEELRAGGKTRIVAFNAWQYNGDESLWAAFLNEFDREMQKTLTWREQLRARFRLSMLRLKWQDWLQTSRAILWMAATLFVLFWMSRFLAHGGLQALTKKAAETGKWSDATGGVVALVGGTGGAVAAVLLFLTQFKDLFRSPAAIDKASKAWSKPNYNEKLPLIHKTIKDFKELVEAYAGENNVYVFVDDLDRCEYTKAADVMQMLLTLLSNAPRVALVLGLDRDKVAAAMAVRQEKVLPYLYQVSSAQIYLAGIEYGQRFLEKFIQVSYVLPIPATQGLKSMINPDATPPRAPSISPAVSAKTIEIVTGKDDSGTLDKIIEMASEVFEHNPRNVKQFVNMFRLQAFIANETGLFTSSEVMMSERLRLTIPQLAKFVALNMRWPHFVDAMLEDEELLPSVQSWGGKAEALDPGEKYAVWARDRNLVTLIGYGIGSLDYQLTQVDAHKLAMIAPPKAITEDRRAVTQDGILQSVRNVTTSSEVKEARSASKKRPTLRPAPKRAVKRPAVKK